MKLSIRRFTSSQYACIFATNVGVDDAWCCFSDWRSAGLQHAAGLALALLTDSGARCAGYAFDSALWHRMLIYHRRHEFIDKIVVLGESGAGQARLKSIDQISLPLHAAEVKFHLSRMSVGSALAPLLGHLFPIRASAY